MKTPEIQSKSPGDSGDHRQDIVEILVNDKPYPIHRGRQTVEEIRKVGNVPPSHTVLEQLIDGKLIELSNNDSVTIKGGEIFISHVPSGTSA